MILEKLADTMATASLKNLSFFFLSTESRIFHAPLDDRYRRFPFSPPTTKWNEIAIVKRALIQFVSIYVGECFKHDSSLAFAVT